MADWHCEKGSKDDPVLNDDAIFGEYLYEGFKK
jgi:hypothetical protein